MIAFNAGLLIPLQKYLGGEKKSQIPFLGIFCRKNTELALLSSLNLTSEALWHLAVLS